MENNKIIITPTDLLRVNYCALGTRMWFRKIGLNWEKFLHQGLPSNEIINTGDAMAIDLIDKIRKSRNK